MAFQQPLLSDVAVPRSGRPGGRKDSSASAVLDPAAAADWQTRLFGSCLSSLVKQDWGVVASVTWFRVYL